MDSLWSSSDYCSPGSALGPGPGLTPGPEGGVTPAAGAKGGGESRPVPQGLQCSPARPTKTF